MSTEYNYPTEQSGQATKAENPFISIHLPFTVLAIAFALFLFGDKGAIKQRVEDSNVQKDANVLGEKNMKRRIDNAEKQIKAIKEVKANTEKLIEGRKELVATAAKTKAQFSDIMKELNSLSVAGDQDATQVIAAFGIKISDNPPVDEKKPDAPKAEEKKAEPAKP